MSVDSLAFRLDWSSSVLRTSTASVNPGAFHRSPCPKIENSGVFLRRRKHKSAIKDKVFIPLFETIDFGHYSSSGLVIFSEKLSETHKP